MLCVSQKHRLLLKTKQKSAVSVYAVAMNKMFELLLVVEVLSSSIYHLGSFSGKKRGNIKAE